MPPPSQKLAVRVQLQHKMPKLQSVNRKHRGKKNSGQNCQHILLIIFRENEKGIQILVVAYISDYQIPSEGVTVRIMIIIINNNNNNINHSKCQNGAKINQKIFFIHFLGIKLIRLSTICVGWIHKTFFFFAIIQKWQRFRCTYSLSFLIIKFEQLKAAIIFQRSIKVPHTVVHFGNHSIVSKALTAR